jgi:hypothetical protein
MLFQQWLFMILHVFVGFMGSSKGLFMIHEFSQTQMILFMWWKIFVDSSCPLWVVSILTTIAHPLNLIFNTWLTKIWVRVKHHIVVFKWHFQSLRGLHIQIEMKQNNSIAMLWIKVCCPLHNLFLKDFYVSSWNFEQGDEKEDDDLKRISNFMGNQTILLSRQNIYI